MLICQALPCFHFLSCLQDLSDDQWRHFRSGLPALTVLFTLTACISHILRAQCVKLHRHTCFYAAAALLFMGEVL